MKTSIITILSLIMLMSCSESKDNDATKKDKETAEAKQTDEVKQTDEALEQELELADETEETTETDEKEALNVPDLVKMGLLKELMNKLSIFEDGGEPNVEINHVYFKPNKYASDYIMVQVILENGDIWEDEFATYYPNEEGDFAPANYSRLMADEEPKQEIKNLIDIETIGDKEPVGVFRDHINKTESRFNIGYNLSEAYIYFYGDAISVEHP